MLVKLASMFLTNIFYYPKVISEIQDFFSFWIILYKLYENYLKVDSSLANTKLHYGANKFCWYANTLKIISFCQQILSLCSQFQPVSVSVL